MFVDFYDGAKLNTKVVLRKLGDVNYTFDMWRKHIHAL